MRVTRSMLFWKLLISHLAVAAVVGIGLLCAVIFFGGLWRVPVVMLSLAVGGWLAVVISIRRAAPGIRLLRHVEEIVAGQRTQTSLGSRDDEFGDLAEAINELVANCAEQSGLLIPADKDRRDGDRFLNTVVHTMTDGVVVVDADLHVLFVNDAARPLLDVADRQVMGRPIWEVVRSQRLHEVMQQVIETGEAQTTELEMPRRRSIYSLSVAPLPRDPCGGALLVVRDLTDLRRLEQLRQDFVSNVSHELKTPLTAIQAYADTLLDGAIDDAEHNERFVHRILEQTERLHDLIVDLLQLARLESQPDVFDVEPVSVDDVVRACLKDHMEVAIAAEISLRAEPAAIDARVMADADEFRTIVDNLVKNALSYTASGGDVVIRWVLEEAGETAIVRLDVIDTGIGISKSQQARIFERFYRADKARSREHGGTGLGLAIVKHLCQTFGGSVSLESEMGSGTTFTVQLPAAGTSATVDPPAQSVFANS